MNDIDGIGSINEEMRICENFRNAEDTWRKTFFSSVIEALKTTYFIVFEIKFNISDITVSV